MKNEPLSGLYDPTDDVDYYEKPIDIGRIVYLGAEAAYFEFDMALSNLFAINTETEKEDKFGKLLVRLKQNKDKFCRAIYVT